MLQTTDRARLLGCVPAGWLAAADKVASEATGVPFWHGAEGVFWTLVVFAVLGVARHVVWLQEVLHWSLV